jgi:ribosomal protein L22
MSPPRGKKKDEEKAPEAAVDDAAEEETVDEAPEAAKDDAPQAQADEAPDGEASKEDAPEEDDSDEADAPEADASEEDEPEADASDDDDAEAAKPARRRRGSEVSAGRKRQQSRRPDGEVIVRARAKYVRSAPRKARLVMDHIRGREVEKARAMLAHAPRAVSTDILKLLDSAVANAESNYELGADELRIVRAYVDEGPTIKRYRPRALGRATRILKRTSHMTIELTNGTR